MARVLCIASLALSAVSAVSGHVIRHRRGAPQGWHSSILQSYPEYHDRYLSWDCENKHNTTFFATCCHPLLSHESLDVLTDAGCDCDDGESPVTSSVPSSSPLPTNTNPAPKAAVVPAPSPTPTTSSAKFRNADASAPAPAAPSSSPPATTSTHEAAPSPSPTSSNNNGNSGSGSDNGTPNTGGQATFFYQEGAAGACGQVHSDSDLICAMDQARYGDSSNASPLCGKKVIITNTQNGKSVTVTVADDCPTCKNSNSIDLSVAAFQKIADESAGEVPISWVFGN